MRKLLLALLLIGGVSPLFVWSKTLTLVAPTGENTLLEVEETDPFLDVLGQIDSYFQGEIHAERAPFILPTSQYEFTMSQAEITIRAKKSNYRDYYAKLTKEEKKDVNYIITSLAYESLIKLGTLSSSLKKAGDRIEHLHPLLFLKEIFTNEKLKVGVHAIRDRIGLVKNSFMDGIEASLSKEAARGNLLQHTSDFAAKIKIDEQIILPYLQSGKWLEFVNILIDTIPRELDANRYNM